MLLLQAVIKLGKSASSVGEIVIHRHFQTLLTMLNLTQQLELIAADNFCSRRRRWRAQVADKIGNGHIGFMADGADHRNAAGKYRPCYALVVKAPQIFQRAAAAPDD